MIQLEHLHMSFGQQNILTDVSLQINKGEIVAILGPSGSGKSTLLRCINLLEIPQQGRVTVAGHTFDAASPNESAKNIAAIRRSTGMVFQNFNLFAHMSALENVAYALRTVRGLPRNQAEQDARDLLNQVGLSAFVQSKPRHLSGGQQQRVAIARALALEPSVMLFDEPTSALDPEKVGDVLTVMKTIADHGMTMVVVSHELRFIEDVATRVLFLEDGNIVEDNDTHSFFHAPRHPRTRAFLKALGR